MNQPRETKTKSTLLGWHETGTTSWNEWLDAHSDSGTRVDMWDHLTEFANPNRVSEGVAGGAPGDSLIRHWMWPVSRYKRGKTPNVPGQVGGKYRPWFTVGLGHMGTGKGYDSRDLRRYPFLTVGIGSWAYRVGHVAWQWKRPSVGLPTGSAGRTEESV